MAKTCINAAAPSDSPARLTFAVMIAAYNAEKTIAKAIDSVLAQTRQADEIMVCDDGSIDTTAAILARYGERISVFHQPNSGVSAARNTLLRQARSDFLVLLDADDTWLPERIERIEEHLTANPHLDIVTTDAWVVDPERDLPARTIYAPGGTWRFPAEARQSVEILLYNFVFCSAAVRRTSLLAVGGWDATRTHQSEYDGWIRMILSGSRAGIVPSPLACYNIHPGSLSTHYHATWSSDLELLESIAATEHLSEQQVGAARDQMGLLVRNLRVLEAKNALRSKEPGVRRKCISALLAPGQRARTRIKLVAAIAAPGLMGRRAKERQ